MRGTFLTQYKEKRPQNYHKLGQEKYCKKKNKKNTENETENYSHGYEWKLKKHLNDQQQ